MTAMVINEMLGKIFYSVEKNSEGNELIFRMNGWESVFKFFHEQDCCESVWIEDIAGELTDLEGVPITEAEVVTNKDSCHDESRTWTFFKFGTEKGCVTVRWCGESNGYYSESVSLEIKQILSF